MTVVANTSPLNYLVLVRAVHVLPDLFGKVIVPTAVVEELSRPKASQAVREWITNPVPWIEIATPLQDEPMPLGPGERAALALAAERNAALVLLDERRATRVAKERGLRVTGTLGVIKLAGFQGLLDLPQTIDALRSTSCRISAALLDQTLEEYQRHLQQGEDRTHKPER